MALARGRHAFLLAAWPAALFGVLASLLPEVMAGKMRLEEMEWVGSLGIGFAFRADGLSLLFALLISGIGAFIFLYASRYLAGDPDRGRFFAFLSLFTGAMLGAVLADDLITLLVFWELTSFASFVLIGYQPENPKARPAAPAWRARPPAGGPATAGRTRRARVRGAAGAPRHGGRRPGDAGRRPDGG